MLKRVVLTLLLLLALVIIGCMESTPKPVTGPLPPTPEATQVEESVLALQLASAGAGTLIRS
ncbi:MAG: hypothetical protein SVX38_04410 [Chloroflexota bacterium]|nr:hypothetical protein [Chloroflexota bacterium]